MKNKSFKFPFDSMHGDWDYFYVPQAKCLYAKGVSNRYRADHPTFWVWFMFDSGVSVGGVKMSRCVRIPYRHGKVINSSDGARARRRWRDGVEVCNAYLNQMTGRPVNCHPISDKHGKVVHDNRSMYVR
jgi:hypothetical protein